MTAENDAAAADRERSNRLDHQQGGEAAEQASDARAGGPRPAAAENESGRTEQVDRDALHQADYGGARGPAEPGDPAPEEEDQQGGASSDDAAGGGRKPTVDRDRDYDPDGDRTGL